MSDKRTWGDSLEAVKGRQAAPATSNGKVVKLYADGDDDTPELSGDYKAVATPSLKPLVDLFVILGSDQLKPGGKRFWTFQYVHLDTPGTIGYDDDGQVVTFSYNGRRPVALTLRGRELVMASRHLSRHRIAWLRVADEELSPEEAVDEDGQPVPFIRSITIADALTGEVLGGG